MTEEQQQQITQKYLFVITPLQIKSNSKLKTNNRKSILIKLGNKTAKCTELNTSIQLEMDVLYSRTLQKYCPIKGIIKIYDVGDDGTQIISCVGGFQTDQLLNQHKQKIVIEKEIGTSKLKMEINILNKNAKKSQQSKSQALKHDFKSSTTSERKQKIETLTKHESQKELLSKGPFLSSQARSSNSTILQGRDPIKRPGNMQLKLQNPKHYDLPYKNTSNSISKSLQKINQVLSFKRMEQSGISSKAHQVLAKAETETAKQQLQQQKRRVLLLDEKLQKANQKMSNYKSTLSYFQTLTKKDIEFYKKLLNALQITDGLTSSKLEQRLQSFTLKQKQKDLNNTFRQFVIHITQKLQQKLPFIDLDHDTIQASRSLYQSEQNKKELAILKKLTTEKDKKIVSLQRQIQGAELTIRNLKQTNKHLGEENHYLKDKNEQVEISLYQKENAIDQLNKQVDQLNQELQQVDNKLYNSSLEIEELKEEISNCQETIQRYRVKYGDLKNVKNRAIQMEIKDCLRWIELQNRDLEMSEIDETNPSDHSDDRGDSLSSVIRNIQIQKMPKEQMSVIRDQLVKILQKVDDLMIK